MTRETKISNVDKGDSAKYKALAISFYEAAKDEQYSERWNAAGILIVHSAIAFADAVAIKEAGQKSTSENHQDVVKLLERVIAHTETRSNALSQLEKLIAHKTTVSYSGQLYDEQDIEKLIKHLERFKTWALKQLGDELV